MKKIENIVETVEMEEDGIPTGRYAVEVYTKNGTGSYIHDSDLTEAEADIVVLRYLQDCKDSGNPIWEKAVWQAICELANKSTQFEKIADLWIAWVDRGSATFKLFCTYIEVEDVFDVWTFFCESETAQSFSDRWVADEDTLDFLEYVKKAES